MFRADGFRNAEYGEAAVFVFFDFRIAVFNIFAGADTGDTAWDVEQVGGNFAGNDIGFVIPCQCEQQVGIRRSGTFKGKGGCSVADNGLDIKPAVDFLQGFFINIDDGNVVAGSGGKVLCDGRTNLTAA